MMNMMIRPEKDTEFAQIYELIKTAFQTAKVSNGKEQDFADQLRAGGNYIPELALVAILDNKLIGHIMLTRKYFIVDNKSHEILYLAPISVVLGYRNKGIGSKLINESFNIAKKMGYGSVIVVGDPAYYHRFGFKPAIAYGIKNKQGIPDEYVMACELIPGSLKGISGIIDFS
jgi:putative acetyltransferase